MKRFELATEPERFEERVRQRGAQWLAATAASDRLPDYWNEFKAELRQAFQGLCAYSAVLVPPGSGEVDHYIGVRESRECAYDWRNYRHASGWMNKAKGHRREGEPSVLDPFEVEDDWFEIHLPSLELKLTERVPAHLRERAAFTLRRLRLRDDETMIELRQVWFQLYQEGKFSLEGLEEMAPLIARAVKKALRPTET